MRDLVIVGTGGVGRALRQFVDDINQVNERWRLLGFLDDASTLAQQQSSELPILGPLEWLAEKDVDVLVGIGEPHIRKGVVTRLTSLATVSFPPLVHPTCYIPGSVSVGQGTILYPGVCINIEAALGSFVIANKNATVGHDTVVEDYVTISPGCSIGGNVVIGTGAFLGIGACAVQQVHIGKWSVVGAGAAVIDDIIDETTVVGVPARAISKKGNIRATPSRHPIVDRREAFDKS